MAALGPDPLTILLAMNPATRPRTIHANIGLLAWALAILKGRKKPKIFAASLSELLKDRQQHVVLIALLLPGPAGKWLWRGWTAWQVLHISCAAGSGNLKSGTRTGAIKLPGKRSTPIYPGFPRGLGPHGRHYNGRRREENGQPHGPIWAACRAVPGASSMPFSGIPEKESGSTSR